MLVVEPQPPLFSMGPCLPSMAERPNLESSFSLESIQNGHHFIVGFKMFLNNFNFTLSSFIPCSPFFYQLTIYFKLKITNE